MLFASWRRFFGDLLPPATKSLRWTHREQSFNTWQRGRSVVQQITFTQKKKVLSWYTLRNSNFGLFVLIFHKILCTFWKIVLWKHYAEFDRRTSKNPGAPTIMNPRSVLKWKLFAISISIYTTYWKKEFFSTSFTRKPSTGIEGNFG